MSSQDPYAGQWGDQPPAQPPDFSKPQRPAEPPPYQQQPYQQTQPYQQPYQPPQQQPYQQPYPPQYQPQQWQDPAQGFGQPYYQQNRGTNGLAIAGMVLGIVWLYWIGSVLAVIFGHIALGQIKTTGQNGRGMAIAAVVLGWIGIAILLIAIIAAVAVRS